MPIYVYGCSNSHRTEELVKVDTASIGPCPECAEPTFRVYGYAMALTQPEVDTRGMFRRFQEASFDLDRHDTGGPSLWQQSKARAKAIDAAGENTTRRQS